MNIAAHISREFADAIKALLPSGAAWDWPEGGLGDSMLLGTAAELVRIDAAARDILGNAIELHRPKVTNWNIREYRRVAQQVLGGLADDLVRVDHLFGPARVGSRIGDRLWGTRSRYILRVRYDGSVVDPAVLWAALSAFKQAHVFLWFEDISGGSYAPD